MIKVLLSQLQSICTAGVDKFAHLFGGYMVYDIAFKLLRDVNELQEGLFLFLLFVGVNTLAAIKEFIGKEFDLTDFVVTGLGAMLALVLNRYFGLLI